MKKKKLNLVLASRSPRRKQILWEAGFQCMTVPSNSSESFSENLTLHENLALITENKIAAVLSKLAPRKQKGIIILAADTVVVIGSIVLGKPGNSRDAKRMLRLLSGKKHRVKTCFSIFYPDERRGVTRIITTTVGFRKLSKSDIEWYVQTNEPFDKAGSYAIQGLGQQFVDYVNGDLQNVVGLPLSAVKWELRKQRWNVSVRRKPSPNFSKN